MSLAILIPVFDVKIYRNMKSVWDRISERFPQVRFCFVYRVKSGAAITVKGNTFICKTSQPIMRTVPGAHESFVSVMAWLLDNSGFSHLMLTGLSSFLRMDLLLNYIDQMSRTKGASACKIFGTLCSGASTIASRDLIETYVKDRKRWDELAYSEFEDVIFSRFLENASVDVAAHPLVLFSGDPDGPSPHGGASGTAIFHLKGDGSDPSLKKKLSYDYNGFNIDRALIGDTFQVRVRSRNRFIDTKLLEKLYKEYYETSGRN